MEAHRRKLLASAARDLLPTLQRSVIDSWHDLIPASERWGPASRERAQAASRVALEAIVTVLEQGDLDDQSWERARRAVFGGGQLDTDEAEQLLRAVRVAGVGVLTDRLVKTAGLSHDERWQLQRDAHSCCTQLLGVRDEPSPGHVPQLLADLEATGPDLQ